MVYIYRNRITKEMRVFGSLKALSDETKINLNSLYNTFSRKGLNETCNCNYRIVKTKIERA